jgi:hypothetical protein
MGPPQRGDRVTRLLAPTHRRGRLPLTLLSLFGVADGVGLCQYHIPNQ